MPIFDPAELQQMRDVRRAWLGGEKAILALHHPRRSVFQRFNFIIGHVLILLRLRKPIAEIGTVKGKTKNEAA